MAKQGVAILGIYAADLAFTAQRQPNMGETLIGSRFAMGPGGKGSNQSVAAARAKPMIPAHPAAISAPSISEPGRNLRRNR